VFKENVCVTWSYGEYIITLDTFTTNISNITLQILLSNGQHWIMMLKLFIKMFNVSSHICNPIGTQNLHTPQYKKHQGIKIYINFYVHLIETFVLKIKNTCDSVNTNIFT
jgi:hypothetical protein